MFNLELTSDHNGSVGSSNIDDVDDGSKTEEDYMELYVAKELKDKITPIEEKLAEQKTNFDALVARVDELEKNI